MSDISSSPEFNDGAVLTGPQRGKRPFAVVLLAIVVILGAIGQFVATGVALMLWFRPAEAQQLFSAPVSDWYWVTTAALSFILGLIYLWISRGLLGGDPQAWMLVNLLAIINMFFALFQLATGAGWATIILGLLILVLNNTPPVRMWFRVYSS
jgi:hypothetical protein